MSVSVVSVSARSSCSPPSHGVSEVQRARLLRSAVRVVSEHGYGRMTVARVADGARVSRRTFYDAFGDREDCFGAVFEDALARAERVVVAAYVGAVDSGSGGWFGGVRAGVGALLEFFEEEPQLARVLVVEALCAGPGVLQARARALERVAVVLRAEGARARGGRAASDGLPAVVAEGVVGAVFGLVHKRVCERPPRVGSLLELRNSLMATVVLPYLGLGAARRELARALPAGQPASGISGDGVADPLAGLPMRVTYRTLRVLGALAQRPGASNRVVGELAGVQDQGQISKLLARLDGLGLIENKHRARAARRDGRARRVAGEANAWCLTARGVEVERALMVRGNSEGGVG